MPATNQTTVILGCNPTVLVTITEDSGSLSISVAGAEGQPDIDGLFFNLADDSVISSLAVFPKENDRELTGFDNEPGGVSTLSNGATVAEGYDVGVQFGQVADSTAGDVSEAGFTIFSEDGTPLTIDDIDLTNLVAVVDSDGGSGIALTTTDGGDAGTIEETTLFEEDFTGLHTPDSSDAIRADGGWDVVGSGEIRTNANNDGVLKFNATEAEGDVSFCFDARTVNVDRFEASGRAEDTMTVEVRIDGGDWVVLDEFRVNADKTALVGSNTGQEIDGSADKLTYEGGVLDGVDGTVQFRIVSDISARDEKIFLDNFESTVSTASDNGADTKVDFEAGLQSGDVVSDQYEGVTISAQRNGDSENSENDAMIFDTDRTTGGDHDLSYSDKGNVIIISEDNDSSDADDNAHGGTISFDFDEPSDVTSLTVLDIEERGGTIDLFDTDGELIRTVDIPITGDNGEAVVELNTTGVSGMDVNLAGSGAVDDLCYSASDDCSDYFVDYVIPEHASDQDFGEDEAEDMYY